MSRQAMSEVERVSWTHGHSGRARQFAWYVEPISGGLKIEKLHQTATPGILKYSQVERATILRSLSQQFGTEWFPLANNVQKLTRGIERPGLGMTILAQKPSNILHAQGASYLGVVWEEGGFLEWNGRHRGIAWRLVQ